MALEVDDLNVSFALRGGRELHAVRGVSLQLRVGDVQGLVGESGSGKSTVLLAILGLLPANATVSGRVIYDGRDILAGGERSVQAHRGHDIAMVFQGSMNALNPVVPIGRQIVEAAVTRHLIERRNAAERARELLIQVGIAPERSTSYPHQLSGGMRQRAMIAMAMSCNPRILLADEPTTSLDVIMQAQIIDLLLAMADRSGASVILVTHDLPLVTSCTDLTHVMLDGKIVESASSDTLWQNPQHQYSRQLLKALSGPAGGEVGWGSPSVHCPVNEVAP